VRSYNSLGKTYLAENRPEEAKRLFDAALRVVTHIEEHGDGSATERGKRGSDARNHIDLLKAETFNNLGELALYENEPERAMEFFERGIEVLSGRKDPSELAILLHNRGSVYKQRGEYEKAEEDILAALDMNKKQHLYQEMASNYYMLSSSASRQGDFARARKYGLKALELDKRTENSVGIAQDLIALGQIAEKEGRRDAAVVYYLRAHRIYESLQLENGVKKVVEYLRRADAASVLEDTVDFDVEIDASESPLPETHGNGSK
jgi:tetratricopeptide (TPR) repeat protein